MSAKQRTIWTFAITSAAVFMATLDNLVVTTALPVIRQDLHASIESLEWTVNAYKRGAFIGAWSGIAGLAVAFGPLVGGAVVSGISWHWIFWLNVPIGIALIPLALTRLNESHGPSSKLDLPGLALASGGLFGIVWGLVRGNSVGWSSPQIVGALTVGVVVLALFVLWELRAEAPMLPMRFFRNRVFTLANVASLLMFFGMFGSIFLLSQFFQTVQGYSPVG